MLIRVRTFDFEGVSVKYASMSIAEAEAFVEDGRKLLARQEEVTAQEWLSRRHGTIISSLNKADEEAKWGEDGLKAAFDNPTADKLYRAILEFSGLNPGEAPAATASASSAAA